MINDTEMDAVSNKLKNYAKDYAFCRAMNCPAYNAGIKSSKQNVRMGLPPHTEFDGFCDHNGCPYSAWAYIKWNRDHRRTQKTIDECIEGK